MSKISFFMEQTINEGKVDEFSSMIAGMVAATKENEPETLQYQWYLAEDGSRCLYTSTFSGSEAALTHLANVGPILPNLMSIAPATRFLVFGSASDDVKEALESFGAVHFPRLGGFHR